MKNLKWLGLSFLTAAVLASCVSTDDYLHAQGTVFLSDGRTPAKNLPLIEYRWVVNYKDGSTVTNPFYGSDLKTDSSGVFAFDSGELWLKSGNAESHCSDVCVSESTGYETRCTTTRRTCEDRCTDWERDSSGDERCTEWEESCTETCEESTVTSYQYCDTYAQDCTYTYPSRTASDIRSAYAEISYWFGPLPMSSQSQYSTLAREGLRSSSVRTDNHTQITENWTQNDTFVTLLSSNAGQSSQPLLSALTRRQQEITDARNAKKARTTFGSARSLGRSYPAARLIRSQDLGTLTVQQKAALSAVRKSCGAKKN